MRTAIDTNVLSALWSKEPLASDIAKNLGNAKTDGGLVVGAPVYAELPGLSQGHGILCEQLSGGYRYRCRFRVSTTLMAGGRPAVCTVRKTATKNRAARAEAVAC